MADTASRSTVRPSFPQRRESRRRQHLLWKFWIPAFVGMTAESRWTVTYSCMRSLRFCTEIGGFLGPFSEKSAILVFDGEVNWEKSELSRGRGEDRHGNCRIMGPVRQFPWLKRPNDGCDKNPGDRLTHGGRPDEMRMPAVRTGREGDCVWQSRSHAGRPVISAEAGMTNGKAGYPTDRVLQMCPIDVRFISKPPLRESIGR